MEACRGRVLFLLLEDFLDTRLFFSRDLVWEAFLLTRLPAFLAIAVLLTVRSLAAAATGILKVAARARAITPAPIRRAQYDRLLDPDVFIFVVSIYSLASVAKNSMPPANVNPSHDLVPSGKFANYAELL